MKYVLGLSLAGSAMIAVAATTAATVAPDGDSPVASADAAASTPASASPAANPSDAPTTAPSDAPSTSPTPNPTPSPTASETPTPDPGEPKSDACGPRPVKPDGSLYSCSFHDDFDGSTLDRSVWVPQTDFVTGTTAAHACYVDDPANIDVSGGTLNLTVRHVDPPVTCRNKSQGDTADYSAGAVTTYRTFSQQYGRFEVRMKVSATRTPGLQEDFWMWPDDRVQSNVPWPAAGEIDVAELYSQYPDLVIPFLHYTYNDNGGPYPGVNTAWNCPAPRGVYHTYTLQWAADRLEIDVDGKVCLVNTSGDPAFQKPYILALTAALGVGSNALTSATPIPATMNVDYVRAWK